jgi:hypothetical protein
MKKLMIVSMKTYNSSSVKPNFSNSVNVAIMKSRLEKSIAEDSDSDETDKIAVSSQDEKTYDSFNEGR